MRAVEALQEFSRAQGVPEKAIFGLSFALEERGSNSVNHALQGDARQKFRVALRHMHDSFIIELRDRGPEFDPTAAAERPSKPKDDDPPGGWGIHLVRRCADEIRYAREGDENVLRLTKRLGEATGPESIC